MQALKLSFMLLICLLLVSCNKAKPPATPQATKDVNASIKALSRTHGVSPETIYFSAQDSTCNDCDDIFGLNTPLADAWSELSYHFDFDDSDSGTFTHTGNSRNQQISGSPRAFHTFECLGETDPNWDTTDQVCKFTVGVRVQSKDGDHDDAFIDITIQPLTGLGGYYGLNDIWCISNDNDFSECPHNDTTRYLLNSPAAGNYNGRLILFQRDSATPYDAVCIGADERNTTIASYDTGSRPIISEISVSTRPGTCNTSYTDASIDAVAMNQPPTRDQNGNLINGYAFNTTITGLKVGSISNGPTYHLANFHDLDMDWEAAGEYTGRIRVHTAAWNCKNSETLNCNRVPYSLFGFYTNITTKSNASNIAPVNIACYDGCGGTNFVFADIETHRSFGHNARFMGLWGGIFSNNWFRGNHLAGNGGRERLTVRPIEVSGSVGATLHDLNKDPEKLDGINNYRSEITTSDYSNRYNVAIENIFNQSSHEPGHESASFLHLGGNYTGEFGNTFIEDDSGQVYTQTYLTGRYKVIRNTTWVASYRACTLRTNFYADESLYNNAADIFIEAPASCNGNANWQAPTAPLSYGLKPGS